MKKSLLTILTIGTCVLMTACGNSANTKEDNITPSTIIEEETPASIDEIEEEIPEVEPIEEVVIEPTFLEASMQKSSSIELFEDSSGEFNLTCMAYNGEDFNSYEATEDFEYFDTKVTYEISSNTEDAAEGNKIVTFDYNINLTNWSYDYYWFCYNVNAFDKYTGEVFITSTSLLGQDEDKWSYGEQTIKTKDSKEVTIKIAEQIYLSDDETTYYCHHELKMPNDYDGLCFIMSEPKHCDYQTESYDKIDESVAWTNALNDMRKIYVISIN